MKINTKKAELIKKLPKRLKVGCIFYDVKILSDEAADAVMIHGAANPTRGVILLRAGDASPQQIANTFLHEVIHVIHDSFGLRIGTEAATEECYTTATANGLCAFWIDNPKAAAWFDEMIRLGV